MAYPSQGDHPPNCEFRDLLPQFGRGLLRRRDVLLGLGGALGLSLPWHLQQASGNTLKPAPGKSGIFVFLHGGASHLDTLDPKPEAPQEIRGSFDTIETRTPGVRFSAHLPKLAAASDRFALLRGVSHGFSAHDLGRRYMVSGTRPVASVQYPGYGSVVAHQRAGDPQLPPYVAIPNTIETPGFLGTAYAAFPTHVTPRYGQRFNVRGLSLRGATVRDYQRRAELLEGLDTSLDDVMPQDETVQGLDQFAQQANDILRSPKARAAFDATREDPAIVQLFGRDSFSQSCLLACRLVEAGVRFVTVTMSGWDTHGDNFSRLEKGLLPQLDAGLSGMLAALQAKQLLDETSVMVTGEFGRTPKINEKAGRDHWSRAMWAIFAGAGVRGGATLGASDARGQAPAGDAIRPDDLAATFYHSLGIDPQSEFQTPSGRPVTLVREGRVIRELFG
jgi:uncharacterized protein (DUF1501 family)